MKTRRYLVLLLLFLALLASGCAPTTAYGRLDRGPSADPAVLAQDPVGTHPASDSTPQT